MWLVNLNSSSEDGTRMQSDDYLWLIQMQSHSCIGLRTDSTRSPGIIDVSL